VPRDLDLGLGSGGRLLERDLEPVLEVGAAPRPAASATATPASEKSLEEILEDGAEARLNPEGDAPTLPNRSYCARLSGSESTL